MRDRNATRGFTLVELMVVVAIVAVLAALAIYAVSRYLAYSKTSEAKQNVGAISRAAVSAYDRGHRDAQTLSEGSSSSLQTRFLCPSADPVPPIVTQVAGIKYQPDTAADYSAGAATVGWRCLGFRIDQPQHYQYWYTANGQQAPNDEAPCTSDCYAAEAQGDLDADGQRAWFARTGQISPASGELLASTTIFVVDENE